MRSLLLSFVFILSFFLTLEAQDYSHEFGKLGGDEIKLTSYVPDKSAEAVVLFDLGKSYFVRSETSFDVIYERSTRIKIFTESGFKWAEVEIPLYHEGGIFELIDDIEAFTYNIDDNGLTRTPLNPSTCQDEKLNEYWNIKKMALPNVKEGSIIEYKYRIKSQYKFNLRDWEFQWKIPVIYSEYEVKMIPFYEYVWLLQGADRFSSQRSFQESGVSEQFGPVTYNNMVHKYIMRNLPAFNDEEYITSINDYIIKLDFQLAKINSVNGTSMDIITTWPALIKELLKEPDFGKFVDKTENETEKIFGKGTLSDKTDKERFDYVLNYVKSNLKWNEYNAKYASKSLNNILKDKFGNSADLNLLTVGLLNGVGIEAYPVLISTRKNGKIKNDYPFLQSFNYVLVLAKIDGKNILTDATDILCSNDRIPANCINDQGLIIKKENVEWTSLQSVYPSEIQTNLILDSLDRNPFARIKTLATEYDALALRQTYGENKKKIIEYLNKDGVNVIDSTVIIQNALNIKNPYFVQYNLTYQIDKMNNKLYILPFLGEIISDNPLKQGSRKYPIDMTYPVKRTYISDDFLENEAPLHAIIFDYYFKDSLYAPNDYLKIKLYFGDIVRKGHEKVVLSGL